MGQIHMSKHDEFYSVVENLQPLTDWARTLGHCSLAVTITFDVGRCTSISSPSYQVVEQILRKGIKRINTLCYGNSVLRRGLSIGAVTVIEGAGSFDRIHGHIGFDPPPTMPLAQFRRIVVSAFRLSKWIKQRPHMKKCWSQEWVNYMLKLGQETLVPSCCFAAKHPSA